MSDTFDVILTNYGLAKQADAILNHTQINATHIAVGDSNGTYYDPVATQTSLVHEVWRGTINNKYKASNNNKKGIYEAVIPLDEGGFSIREVGVFDDLGGLLAIGKFPYREKPLPSSGVASTIYVSVGVEFSNSAIINITVDETTVLASISYVNNLLETNDALVFKGVIDCSANPDFPAANIGHTYKINVAGKIGGASGINVEVGDTIYCINDNSSSGSYTSVGTNWVIVQTNIDGAVVGPIISTDNAVARFDSTTGKLIQNSLVTIDDSGSINLPEGQNYKIGNVPLTQYSINNQNFIGVGVAISNNTIYQAASNGFLCLKVYIRSANDDSTGVITVYNDNNINPTTVVDTVTIHGYGSGGAGVYWGGNLLVPINKNSYYKFVSTGGSINNTTAVFYPLAG